MILYTFQVNVSVSESGQHTVRNDSRGSMANRSRSPISVNCRFDSIPRYSTIWYWVLDCVCVRIADRKGVRGTQVEFN